MAPTNRVEPVHLSLYIVWLPLFVVWLRVTTN
jgi:hypothetical protein